MLLLDAGDALVRDRTPATSSEGKSSVELMNRLGYDAMALGEGDLQLLRLALIEERMQQADFVFLSANTYVAGSDQRVATPYVIRDIAGQRVAIVGLTGQASIEGIEIRDPLQTLDEIIAPLREQTEILILLSHTGMGINREIASRFPDIDLIVSGGGAEYTQEPHVTREGPVIIQADTSSPGHAGRRIGVGTWDFSSGELVSQSWSIVPLSPEVPADAEMAKWVQENP
jgi:2',3'-cyclic-nucleotide 2'-phosphodiesterase (5'-nucleotidase family)